MSHNKTIGIRCMNDASIAQLPTATLKQLESSCSDVIAEICRAVSCSDELVVGIRSVMRLQDSVTGIELLRTESPEIAHRLITAAFGVLVNAVNLVSIQDELQARERDLN
jgi:hypothetical protein